MAQTTAADSALSDVRPGSSGRTALGFVLESQLRARRLRDGRPSIVFELGDGATVLDGDRLQVHVRTSEDAYLYLAFCSQHAKDPRFAGLKVFPDTGAIHARAYEVTVAPDRAAEIVLDDKPGQEALYLIFSRRELSSSDAELAQLIAIARQGHQSTDCGPPFHEAIAGPRKDGKTGASWSGSSRPRRAQRASPNTRSGSQKQPGPEKDPIVEIQRGGDIVWNNGLPMGVDADPDGIVILRYGLRHVAAR